MGPQTHRDDLRVDTISQMHVEAWYEVNHYASPASIDMRQELSLFLARN